MTTRGKTDPNSVETILTFNTDDDNVSDFSTVWSTSQVAGMGAATGGGGSRRRRTGRRRMRIASLALCSMITMHVHISATAITSGNFILMLMLLPSVAILGNPLRHFEVYLGEWSIGGPGRAFRILPMFDGTGIAICIHAICRAIMSALMAGITGLYIYHSVSDDVLPFSYCRHFNLTSYEPEKIFFDDMMFGLRTEPIDNELKEDIKTSTVGMSELGWRKAHYYFAEYKQYNETRRAKRTTVVCKEMYPSKYPPIYKTPPYNFFYVELMHYRPDHSFGKLNVPLIISTMIMWGLIWIVLILEKINHGRVIWNNMYSWFSGVPWVWSLFVLFTGIRIFIFKEKHWLNTYEIGGKRDFLTSVTDALMISAYIHAAGLGTEIIHGKGLNYYASGHIDPDLNGENLWHSGFLLILTCIASAGAEICALTDSMHTRGINDNVEESMLWMFPMYSKCALQTGNYKHSTFIEQVVVGLMLICCACLSLPFATNGGMALLEGLDSIMTGVGMPLVCCLETFSFIFMYRSHDFVSDLNIATEDNACASRLGIQWQILPFICLVLAIVKTALLFVEAMEIPTSMLWLSSVPVLFLIVSVPLHAVHNAIKFSNRSHR